MHLNRRTLLGRAGLSALLWTPLSHPWARPRRARSARPTLVVVFLRGGADGLNLVVPHGDPAYAGLRDWMAIPPPGAENGALELDGHFGLNPRAAALAPLFADGTAVALHAVGSPANTRSHFEEQDSWETALLDNDLG